MPSETETTTPSCEVEPASANAAVARCCDAMARAQQSAQTSGRGRAAAIINGAEAYRQAMPPLSGAENIRDFIACVAHAILIRVITASDASRLLYAARVAQSSLNRLPDGEPKHTAM